MFIARTFLSNKRAGSGCENESYYVWGATSRVILITRVMGNNSHLLSATCLAVFLLLFIMSILSSDRIVKLQSEEACTYYVIRFCPILDTPLSNQHHHGIDPPPLKWSHNMWTETATFDFNNATKNDKKLRCWPLQGVRVGLWIGGSIVGLPTNGWDLEFH